MDTARTCQHMKPDLSLLSAFARELCEQLAIWGDTRGCLQGIGRAIVQYVPAVRACSVFVREGRLEPVAVYTHMEALPQREMSDVLRELSYADQGSVMLKECEGLLVSAFRCPSKDCETLDVVFHVQTEAECSSAREALCMATSLAHKALRSLASTEEQYEQKAMKRLEGLRTEILATLSHEMRTPLAGIKGYVTALLREDVDWDKQIQTEFLQVISDESDKLEHMIKNILDMTAAETGTLNVEKRPTLLPRLVAQVVSKITLGKGKHRFILNFSPNFPVMFADPIAIEQVFYNLLDNSVKYSQPGSLIVVTGRVSGDTVTVSVADQGQGISPEHLNRLFEKYFRVKHGEGGVGLGLPIARQIIEQHGGRIWAESVLGKGTTVTFTLPLEPQGKDMP